MSTEERAPYEEMARQDRARYEEECEVWIVVN